MNLDKLKESWQALSNDIQSKNLNEQQVRELMKKKAGDALQKMNRNLIGEFYISVVLYAVVLVALLYYFDDWSIINLAIVGVTISAFVFTSIFLFYRYRQLHAQKFSTENLITKLNDNIDSIENFLKAYRTSAIVLYPFGLLAGILLIIEDNAHFLIIGITFLLGMILGIFAIQPLMKWYLNKLYRVHLNELKECLKELEE